MKGMIFVEWFWTIIQYLLPIIPIGLIFAIVNGIVRHAKYEVKIIANLILGIILLLGFTIPLLIDYLLLKKSLKAILAYINFPITALIFLIIMPLYFYIKGRRYLRWQSRFRNGDFQFDDDEEDIIIDLDDDYYFIEQEEPIEEIIYNIYVVFQNNGQLILKKELNGLKGFTNTVNSSLEEALYEITSKYQINIKSLQQIGHIVHDNMRTYCYLIDIASYDEESEDIMTISKYELNNYPIDLEDKELILRILIKEPFIIEK